MLSSSRVRVGYSSGVGPPLEKDSISLDGFKQEFQACIHDLDWQHDTRASSSVSSDAEAETHGPPSAEASAVPAPAVPEVGASSDEPARDERVPEQIEAQSVEVYVTTTRSRDSDIAVLNNNAVVELSAPARTSIEYRAEAVLFETNAGWTIWFEGSGQSACRLLRTPEVTARVEGRLAKITNVRDGGELLDLSDDTVVRVTAPGHARMLAKNLHTGSTVLIINDRELVNLETGDAIVDVVSLR
jgi:hypothetical protein